ncbi:MAG: globin domain-containing protein [Flavobacteriaceae bacterium]
MNSNQLIQQSFSIVEKNKTQFIEDFYSDLFEMAPEVQYLFTNTTKEKQGEKLYNALVILVENIASPEVIVEMLEPLGQDHIGYGTQPHHYKLVGECLINSIKKLNGDAWSSEAEKAWLETYQVVANIMIG